MENFFDQRRDVVVLRNGGLLADIDVDTRLTTC